jgi:hypothetical protein
VSPLPEGGSAPELLAAEPVTAEPVTAAATAAAAAPAGAAATVPVAPEVLAVAAPETPAAQVAAGALLIEPVPAAVRTTSGAGWVTPAAAGAGLAALALTGWTVARKRVARGRDRALPPVPGPTCR